MVYASTGQWYDSDCDEYKGFVCEKQESRASMTGTEELVLYDSAWNIVDRVGEVVADSPSAGFTVCGEAAASAYYMLMRKVGVNLGVDNSWSGGVNHDWTASAGTSHADCEWLLIDSPWKVRPTALPVLAPTPGPTAPGSSVSHTSTSTSTGRKVAGQQEPEPSGPARIAPVSYTHLTLPTILLV